MRRLTLTLVAVAVVTFLGTVFAQEWHWQNPLPQGNEFLSLEMVDADQAWATGEDGVLFRTVDGGTNWERLDDGTGCALTALCFIDALHGWAAIRTEGIFRTEDGGDTWAQVYWPSLSETEPDLEYLRFTSADTGWAFGQIGEYTNMGNVWPMVLHTTDGGLTWERRYPLTEETPWRDIWARFACVDGLHAWLISDSTCCWRTTDGGANWIPAGLPAPGFRRAWALDFTDLAQGWMAGYHSFYHTSDSGLTWSSVEGVTSNYWSGLGFANASDGWLLDGTPQLLLTHDAGTTWTPVSGVPGFPISKVDFADGLNGCVAGAHGQLACTHDGGVTWLTLGQSVSAGLRRVMFVDTSYGWALGDSGALARTTNGGARWSFSDRDPSIHFSAVAFATRDSGWAVGCEVAAPHAGIVRATRDGGATWTVVDAGIRRKLVDVSFVNAHLGWVAADSDSVAQTIDGGATWTARAVTTGHRIGALKFVDANHGWLLTQRNLWGGRLIRTQDGGTTWELPGYGLSPWDHEPRMSWPEPDLGWIMNGHQIYHFAGNTLTNQQYPGNMIDFLSDIAFQNSLEGWAVGWEQHFRDDCGRIVYSLFFHTVDGGNTWETVRSPAREPLSLCFVDVEHGWAVDSVGDILCYDPTPLLANPTEPSAPQPSVFTLAAYPNPFNPQTRLEFDLPNAGRVTLAIYDVIGRQVAVLADATLPAGHHAKTFDGSTLASGIYFARLESGNLRHTQKLVLLK